MMRLKRSMQPVRHKDGEVRIPKEFLDYCGLDCPLRILATDGRIEILPAEDPEKKRNEAILKRTETGWRSNRGNKLHEL